MSTVAGDKLQTVAQKADDVEAGKQAILASMTKSFIEFRKALTSVLPYEQGLIDDLTLTWTAREREKEGDKEGSLHITLYTRTVPGDKNAQRAFYSCTVDSKVLFEDGEKSSPATAKKDDGEKIEEIVTAAAAANK